MKRTTIVLSLAAAALLGPAAAAQAAISTHQSGHSRGTHLAPACGCSGGHHGHHGHDGKGRGHHALKPKPPVVKHHPRPCPPSKHHHPSGPPITVHPRPPVITPAKPVAHAHVATPAARVRAVVAPTDLPTQLAYTASSYDLSKYVVIAVLGIAAGGSLVALIVLTEPSRRFNREVTR